MIEEMGGDFLQWLRGFYYVAKRGSVTLAAREMGRNQPTISHQIKCLENAFGVTFFDRSGGKMTLTPEGNIFLEKTISLFEIIKEMKSDVGDRRITPKGRIGIATTHAVSNYFLPTFIVPFRKAYPDVIFEIEGGGLSMIIERLESAEVDFGIANLSTVPDGLVYHQLFETRLKLIAGKGSAFFAEKSPTLEQISRAPFIFFPRSSTITPLIERRFAESELPFTVIMILNNYMEVKKYVGLGLGVSILDDYTLTDEDEKRLDIYPLDRYFGSREYGLILRKRKYLSPAVKAFIGSIKPEIKF